MKPRPVLYFPPRSPFPGLPLKPRLAKPRSPLAASRQLLLQPEFSPRAPSSGRGRCPLGVQGEGSGSCTFRTNQPAWSCSGGYKHKLEMGYWCYWKGWRRYVVFQLTAAAEVHVPIVVVWQRDPTTPQFHQHAAAGSGLVSQHLCPSTEQGQMLLTQLGMLNVGAEHQQLPSVCPSKGQESTTPGSTPVPTNPPSCWPPLGKRSQHRDLTLPSRAASERAGDSGCHLVPTAPGGGPAWAGESPRKWPGPHAQASANLTRCCESREPHRARRSPEPTAIQNSGVYSYSTPGKQHTQFLQLRGACSALRCQISSVGWAVAAGS